MHIYDRAYMINMSWAVALSQASDDMMIALDSWPLARVTDGQTSQHCLKACFISGR